MIFKDFFQKYTTDILFTLANISVMSADGTVMEAMMAMQTLAEKFKAVHETGGKIIFIGNGGSAAMASHHAFDYWKNGKMRAIAFNDSSLLTGGGNDFGYPEVFSQPLGMFAEARDLVITISSSGQSPNILNAAKKAKEIGCYVVTMSAFKRDNPLRSLGDVNIYLDTMVYGYAELGHETILHSILDFTISGSGS
ncbi:SIS domain-containing protein [Patescibacteria group bacterium]|nr:SIS domain-containing protein [Patescibacteria group bacterium]